MKTGSGLALIAIGAILAFAVTASTSVFSFNAAGWVLMIVGIISIIIPRRSYSWVGRRMFVRRYETRRDGKVEHVTYPPYATRNPANTRVRASLPAATGDDPVPERVPGETEVTEDIYEE